MAIGLPSIGGYLRYMLSPFFWPWWAILSGIASILSWYQVPLSGLTIPYWLTLLLFTLLLMGFFLLASVLCQGWRLYGDVLSRVRFVGIQASTAYGGEQVVLLECSMSLPVGTLLEIQRTDNGVEVPIALVEVRSVNSKSQLQAHPVWFGPVHLNDLMKSTLSLASVRVTPFVSVDAAHKANIQSASAKA